MKRLFILGADDPEMRRIEELLVLHNQRYRFATVNERRVHPGNAYKANFCSVEEACDQFVRIECDMHVFFGYSSNAEAEAHNVESICIDHHFKGHAGFDLPPEKFWEASSIGQLYMLLGIGEPKQEDRVLAAMDHCMVAARKGLCPGVTGEEVKALRRTNIARACHTEIDEVEHCIDEIKRDVFADCPSVQMGNQMVLDATKAFMGVGYSLKYLCCQEALFDLDQPALLWVKDTEEGSDKVVLTGTVSEAVVKAFVESWAPSQGLTGIYGAEARGYAGGYRKKS